MLSFLGDGSLPQSPAPNAHKSSICKLLFCLGSCSCPFLFLRKHASNPFYSFPCHGGERAAGLLDVARRATESPLLVWRVSWLLPSVSPEPRVLDRQGGLGHVATSFPNIPLTPRSLAERLLGVPILPIIITPTGHRKRCEGSPTPPGRKRKREKLRLLVLAVRRFRSTHTHTGVPGEG